MGLESRLPCEQLIARFIFRRKSWSVRLRLEHRCTRIIHRVPTNNRSPLKKEAVSRARGEKAKDRGHTHKPEFLPDDGKDKVRVRLGQEEQLALARAQTRA